MYTYFRKGSLIGMAMLLLASPAWAVQSITFVILKPPVAFEDGRAFGPNDKLVYLVYDKATGKQLFSTFAVTTVKNDIPDTATCFFAKAALFDSTTNNYFPDSLSDPSPDSCPPALTRKVGVFDFKATR